jgi:choline-sulfatase
MRAGSVLAVLAVAACAARGPRAAGPASGDDDVLPASGTARSAEPSSAGSPGEKTEPTGTKGVARLNVILILVDSLRADMPWTGYPREIAPHLTKLESESVSYTRAYAVSSYTAKSVGALLSGQYPSTLKRNGYFFTRFTEDARFFPELLQQSGVHTMSAHAHRTMKQDNKLDQGFDEWRVVAGITADTRTDDLVSSDDLTELAIELLEGHRDRRNDDPLFLYLHYLDPHRNYLRHAAAPDFGDRARDRYDEEVFFTDLWIGRLLEYCAKQPWFAETAVIVSADHGEAFGEHGMHRHAFELWDVLTHVPLFVRLPGASPRRIDVPRSHIDLAPTILELMGGKVPPEYAGKSMLGELRGEAPETRPVVLDLPADSNNAPRRALISGDYKLLSFDDTKKKSIYDLKSDPGELRDLSGSAPEKLAELVALESAIWAKLPVVKPYGGNQLVGGGVANGPR